MWLLIATACSDPPLPPALPAWNGSTASRVEWRRPDAPVRGPVVRVSDRPGGDLDRLVADPDVTTFLNDRFHPVFAPLSPTDGPPTVAFLDGCGCPLGQPLTEASPEAFIARANAVIVDPAARACEGAQFSAFCTRAP